MIKTIILLVIVFYTFPCRKINAQSRDTSNIFAGYYIAVYNKSDLSHKKIRRHHKHSYNTAIDSRYRTYFIPIKIGKNNINQENIWKEVTDNKTESDTIFIFPDSTDIKLFKQIGLIDSNISDKKHLLLQEIKSLPYYNTASNKAYLFKCLYVKGTFLQLRIDTIDKNWQDYLLDIYSISTKKKKKLLLVTGIDSLHSIKSDGTSIQARPYIKTGQQKPCTALIVGNWFAGEEGYIRKEALLEQGEPFVSWIRCNDCPQIRFNESNSGSVVYPGPPVSWNDPSNPDDPQAGYGYIPNDTTKEETFFYHSDHLGSTSYITDDHANITQYDAYLPYGELLVDEHSSSEDLPYKFNGKQFDEETGLYYYGARYMNPVTSLWYGMDALTEKYPNVTGYCYTFNNPIKLLDPDGNSPIGAAVEGISAFVVSAGVDFISNWIFEGMDYKTAFRHVHWGASAFDGISTAAISLLVDGAGTTKTIGKIANSKAGRFAIDVARTMITNIIGDIEKGIDFNKIDLTEEFISATFSTLLDKGMEKRANELLSGLESSNKKLYTALNKLKRNQKAGKSEARLKSDVSRVKIAKDRYRGDVRKYAKAVTKKNLVVAGGDLAFEKAFKSPDKKTSNKNNK